MPSALCCKWRQLHLGLAHTWGGLSDRAALLPWCSPLPGVTSDQNTWSVLPSATPCTRARMTLLLTECLLGIIIQLGFEQCKGHHYTWIQGNWRGSPLLLGIPSALPETGDRKMEREHLHEFDFYSISKIRARAVWVVGEHSREESNHTLKFIWKTLAQKILYFIDTRVLSWFRFSFTWEAALAYWKVNMVWTFAFLPSQHARISRISSFLEKILEQEFYSMTSLSPRGTVLLC